MRAGSMPKIVEVLKNYSRDQFMKDVVAGVIVAIIALPLSIALALASGVGPEQGIYTAIVAGFVIALLGGSRVQVSGPTAAFATIVAGIVATKGMPGLVVATILAGIILILMGLLKFGSLIKFIPYTIVTGFTSGIAVTIFIGQLKDFFGLTFKTSPIETMEKLKECIVNFGTINVTAFFIGALALAILIVWPKINEKIPASLIAILVTAAIVKLADLNVNTIGSLYEISNKVPTPHVPAFSLELVQNVLPDALTIAILAAIESLLSCVVADGMINDQHNPNVELVAQGAGNIASGIFGGIPATGAIARTAANIKNGGRSPVSAMVHSVVLLLILIILMPYAALIPMPAIASILFMVAYNMCGWKEFVYLLKKAPKCDSAVLVLTFVLTIVFDLVVAIEAGFALAVLLFLKRMAEVVEIKKWIECDENDPDLMVIPEGTVVYEIAGPLFFAVSDSILKVIGDKNTKVLILRMTGVTAIDVTALRSLEMVKQSCDRDGIVLMLTHVQKQPHHMMDKSGFLAELGSENLCENIHIALAKAKELCKN